MFFFCFNPDISHKKKSFILLVTFTATILVVIHAGRERHLSLTVQCCPLGDNAHTTIKTPYKPPHCQLGHGVQIKKDEEEEERRKRRTRGRRLKGDEEEEKSLNMSGRRRMKKMKKTRKKEKKRGEKR